MEMRNVSPFPNLRFYNTDNRGKEFGVVLAKGTYVVRDGRLWIADEQAPILFQDTYHGALNTSSLWMPSDLVAHKPRTDIILNAVARSPAGRPRAAWTCAVRIEGGTHAFERRLQVCGPREWIPTWRVPDGAVSHVPTGHRDRVFKGWRLQEPEETTEVPLRYEFAYGGTIARPGEQPEHPWIEAFEHNPVGRGWIDAEHTPRDRPVPAPQIESFGAPPLAAMDHAEPAGFGPIPPVWLPRRPLGGTYDDHWREKVWPNWPADYDFAYNNSAAPGMVFGGYLQGNETIVLEGLYADGTRSIRLPDHRMSASFDSAGRGAVELVLDTLFLDIADEDEREHRAFLSWRGTFEPASTHITFLGHQGPLAFRKPLTRTIAP